MARQVAFLGLGVMGFPMAGHLAAAGHDVTVWNRTGAKAAAWTEKHKGRAADAAKDAAKDAEFVFICVGDDPDVRAVAEPALDALGVALPIPYFCYFSMVTLLVLGPTFMFLENQTEGKLSSVPTSASPPPGYEKGVAIPRPAVQFSSAAERQ